MSDNMEPELIMGTDGVPYIQSGEYVLRLDLEPLSGEYKERAKNELRESEENYENSLKELKELVKADEELYLPLDEDDLLLKFLRPCKFYPESAFKLLTKYYKFKAKNPKFCSELYPQTVTQQYADKVIDFVPIRENGTRIMVVAVEKWNPKSYGIHLLFRAVILAIEIGMIEPKTQVSGVHVILDLEKLTLTHIMQVNPSTAKLIMDFIQYCIPIRLKGIHVVNQPIIFNVGYAIFKPFLTEKFKKRLKFHGTNWSSLHEHVSPDSLPKKYGGNMIYPGLPGPMLVDLLQHYDQEYRTVNAYGYSNKLQKDISGGEI